MSRRPFATTGRRSTAILAALALAGALLAPPALAGHRTGAFADIEPGPRWMAMGGAGAAGVDDPAAGWWNPAGLYFMRGTQATATYEDLYGQGLAQRNYLALAWKKVPVEPSFEENRLKLDRDLARGGAWGFALSSVLVDLEGDDYSEFMPSVSYAGGLGRDLGIGFTLAYLRASSSLEGISASGYNLTLGALYRLPGGGRAGVSVRNLLSRVFWEGEVTDRLPVTPALGLSWPVGGRGRIMGDAVFAEDDSGPSRLSAGGEYWFLDRHVAGRAGLRHYGGGAEARTVPSFGVGLHWKRLDFDYALTADGDGPGSTHRFGLNVLLAQPQ